MPLTNVLYVDDDKDWRNKTRTDFQERKLAPRIDISANRDSGVRKIRSTYYDLIVVDGLEGECFNLIDAVVETPHGPIVIFSSDVAVMAKARNLGIPFYMKPDGLAKIVRDYKK